MLRKRLLLVLSDVWQLNCFSAWLRPSAANKQQSPRDSAGDYQQPDFIDVANCVYYRGSEVTHCLITSGGARRRGWLSRETVADKSGCRTLSLRRRKEAGGVTEEFKSFGNWEVPHLQPVTQRLSSPISAIHHVCKIINLIPPQKQLVADGIHPCLVPVICYVLVLRQLTSTMTCNNLKLKPVVTQVKKNVLTFVPRVVARTCNKQWHINVSMGSPGDENQDEFACSFKTKSSIMLSYKTGQKDHTHKTESSGFCTPTAAEVISQDLALLLLSAL